MNKRVMSYMGPYKWQTILGFSAKLLEAILEIILPTLMAFLINEGVINGDQSVLAKYGILMVIMVLVGFAASVTCQYLAAKVAQDFGTDLRRDTFAHILSLDHAQVHKLGSSTLTTRLTSDINQVQIAVNMGIRLLTRSPFVIIGAVVMSLYLDVPLAMILLSFIPAVVLALVLIIGSTSPVYTRYQEKLDHLSSTLYQQLQGIRIIRAFVAEKKERNRFEDANKDCRRELVILSKVSTLLSPLTTLIIEVAIALILWVGARRAIVGGLELGTLVAFVNYATQIVLTLTVASQLVILITKGNASRKRLQAVLDIEPQQSYGEIQSIDYQAKNAIEFDNVCFSYYGTERKALRDIDITIPMNKTIGIIGGTGAGKTSLIHLLQRNFDIDSGELKLFGRDIKDYDKKTLKELTSVVTQKKSLLKGTIRSNLLMAKPNASDDELIDACKSAQAWEFIEQLDEQLDSVVERGGVNFSGGQKQRLCIARALLKESPILILDDSFSALDMKTDAILRNSLAEKENYASKIIISQRISTLLNCDTIYFFDHGHLIESGSHKKLFRVSKDYRELALSQNIDKEGNYNA